MEISEVRRRLSETVERAKRAAADRRVRVDEAGRAYSRFVEDVATPLVRQLASALKASGYPFTVFTPGGSLRLASDRSADDYLELSLDTTVAEPVVVVHVRRARGRNVIEHTSPVHAGPISQIDAELLLSVLLRELEPFVER
jgi:hypothetical protein